MLISGVVKTLHDMPPYLTVLIELGGKMYGVHLAELCLTLSYLEMCIVIMHVFCYLSVC